MSYCTITELEMDVIFKPEKNWVKEYSGHCKEIVYTKVMKNKPWIKVMVYSSLNKNNGISAGLGKDSIKVCAISLKTNKGIIKTKRIHRVPGWDKRLVERVTNVWEELK